MSYKIVFDTKAQKDCKDITKAILQRMQKTISSKLAKDPYTFGKPLQYSHSGSRSLRVGDYRIIYIIDEAGKTVKITAIGHRRDIYTKHLLLLGLISMF